jgi:class 3 adenylate cyclase/putative methionine-R-sulfoxide reductase with GAF domain
LVSTFKKQLNRIFPHGLGLRHRLFLAFALFFICPNIGFIYFAFKYDMLSDRYVPVFFLAVLILSFIGLVTLRKFFDRITSVSLDISQSAQETTPNKPLVETATELETIVTSFHTLERELRSSCQYLDRKNAEIMTLKELSELCYMTFNADDLLSITLERALKLVDADVGSILMLDSKDRDSLVVHATIGLAGHTQKGDQIVFNDSIAKYAFINKSPILVSDIEKDPRFGRSSRPQYATKSFILLPLKSIQEVIGVLSISRRFNDEPFTQEDVDVLIPLVSNAAFTYDNLRLIAENEEINQFLKTMGAVSQTVNSSLRGSELLQAVLQDIRGHINYDIAVILDLPPGAPKQLSVVDFLAFIPTGLSRGMTYKDPGPALEKAIRQQSSIVIENDSSLSHPLEKELCLEGLPYPCLLIPLKVEGRTTGVLILCRIDPLLLSGKDMLLNMLSDALSQAIEKEKLVLSSLRHNQALETLRQIGYTLSTITLDLEKVLKHTMEMNRIVFNVAAGILYFIKENRLISEVTFNINIENVPEDGFSLHLGQGIAGYAAARGETIVVQDAQKYPHFDGAFDRATGFRTFSSLCVPMISQGKVIGVIELLNKIEGSFDDNDEHLLQSISTSVSIAMENNRLYRETLAMAENERGIRNVFQKFVPKAIVDKITLGVESGDTIPIEEFRSLTLLNIDIRGFSPISKRIGPRKTVAMLNQYFSIMGNIVFKHYGIVDKYLGDGFLALFGAPVSSTSDADNAVAAAREMQQAIADMNREFSDRYHVTLVLGITIHTGEVVVGNIGFEKKMDYTVIGDAVNFLFKLQSLCKAWPNQILISEKTLEATQSPPQTDEVGSFEIEGGTDPLKIYRVRE